MEVGWMVAVDREEGEVGRAEGEFRPAEAHLDRLGLSKGGRGIPPSPVSLPWPSSSSPMVLSSFVVLPLSLAHSRKRPTRMAHVYMYT